MSKKGKWLSATVGKIIASRRKELGKTQAEVAEALRIQRTSLTNIETGKQVLLLDVFYDLCKELDLRPGLVIEQAEHDIADETEQLAEIDEIIQNTNN